MPPLETCALLQDAALWALSDYDEDGREQVSAPVDIKCRWEDNTGKTLNAENEEIKVTATIDVTQAITVGSVLRLGTVASVPATPNNLVQVIDYNEIPDIRNRDVQRYVTVRRIHKLPEVV